MNTIYDAESVKFHGALQCIKSHKSHIDRNNIISEMYDRFCEVVERFGMSGIPEKYFYFDSDGKIPFYQEVDIPELHEVFRQIEYDFKVHKEWVEKRVDVTNHELDHL